jgi:hypothetical protein
MARKQIGEQDLDQKVDQDALDRMIDRKLGGGHFSSAALRTTKKKRAAAEAEATAKTGRKRKSGPHDATLQFLFEWLQTYPREKEFRRADEKKLAMWIAKLKENERRGKSLKGKVLSQSELRAVREYREGLELRLANLQSKKTKPPAIHEIRQSVSEGVARAVGRGELRGERAVTFIREKLKRARRSFRRVK